MAVLVPAALAAAACAGSSGGQPVLTGAAPARLNAGQSFVIIEGSNFARGARAQLGDQPVMQLTWVNASVLTGLTPAGMAPGSYDLSVTNPNGASATLRGGIAVVGAGGASPTVAPTAVPSARATSPAATATATQTPPSATRSPAPATRSPEPATASPTATRTPTRAPTRAPTPTPQPTPAASGWPNATVSGQGAIDLSGDWQITDGVTYGPGNGQSFSFTVRLSQQGTVLSGSGDGLNLSGTVSGLSVHAAYTQDNGSGGTFDWTLAADGNSFAGTFTNSSGNGGTSSGQRLSAAFAAAPANEKPPAAVPAEDAGGRGGRKKKER